MKTVAVFVLLAASASAQWLQGQPALYGNGGQPNNGYPNEHLSPNGASGSWEYCGWTVDSEGAITPIPIGSPVILTGWWYNASGVHQHELVNGARPAATLLPPSTWTQNISYIDKYNHGCTVWQLQFPPFGGWASLRAVPPAPWTGKTINLGFYIYPLLTNLGQYISILYTFAARQGEAVPYDHSGDILYMSNGMLERLVADPVHPNNGAANVFWARNGYKLVFARGSLYFGGIMDDELFVRNQFWYQVPNETHQVGAEVDLLNPFFSTDTSVALSVRTDLFLEQVNVMEASDCHLGQRAQGGGMIPQGNNGVDPYLNYWASEVYIHWVCGPVYLPNTSPN